MRSLILFFFISIFTTKVYAQNKGLENSALHQLTAISWAERDARIPNGILCAYQSPSGYIWLATYEGILKIDGHTTSVYDKSNLSFLRSNSFRNIASSPLNGEVYFVSQSSGIVVLKEGQLSLLEVENGEIPLSMEIVLPDDYGNLWLGTIGQGLFKVAENEIFEIAEERLGKSTILAIVADNDGALWVGTEGEGVYKLQGDSIAAHFTQRDGLNSNIVNTILPYKNRIIFGTRNGLASMEEGTIRPIDFMNKQRISNINIQREQLWVGSDNGLGRIDLEKGTKEYISSLENINITRTDHLMFDNEGSLWISSNRNGLIQLRETGIINYTRNDGLLNDDINVVVENIHGRGFLMGADDGHVYELREDHLEKMVFQNPISPTGIRDILQQQDGTLWIASYNGLMKKKGAKEKVYSVEDGLPSLDVRRVLEDSRGNLWGGTRSGGLFKIRNDSVVEVLNTNNKLKADFILALEEDQNGNIYAGTYGGGMAVIHPSGEVKNYEVTDNDAGIIIFNIHTESPGNLWLVSTAGIFYFHEEQFHQVKLEESYKGMTLFDWLVDDKGGVWITGTDGVIHIQALQIEAFKNNYQHVLEGRLINDQDGMVDKECTGAVRSLKSQNGNLYIPTLGGVSVIHPDRISTNQKIPPVYIERLIVDSAIYKIDEKRLVIPPGNVRYKFDFTALSFIAPSQMNFKYKLENFDPDFIELGNLRYAEYTNLPPGNYTFSVKASNNDGLWNKEGASVNILIEPFYYQTTWFYALIIGVLVIVIYILHQWRLRSMQRMNKKLMKVNSELDSFVYSASHDLRSPLASMLGLIDLSRKDSENSIEYLGLMERSIRRMDDFIAEIIDFSSNERKEVVSSPIEFYQMVESILKELEFLDLQHQVNCEVSIRQDAVFHSDKRRLAIIFRNLISNGLKYRNPNKDNPYLKIDILVDSKNAKIKISDNGIGIDGTEHDNIFKMFYRATELSTGSGLGLYIVKETVEKLQGSLQMTSKINEGTKFVMTFPSLSDK